MSFRIVNIMHFLSRMQGFFCKVVLLSILRNGTSLRQPTSGLGIHFLGKWYVTDRVTFELVSFEHWWKTSSSAFSTTVWRRLNWFINKFLFAQGVPNITSQTYWRNPVKLDKTRKFWYLLLGTIWLSLPKFNFWKRESV